MQRMTTASVIFLFVLTTHIQAAEKKDPSGVSEANPQLKAELEEIDDIRSRLGINLFKGTVLENGPNDADAAAQFLEIYRRLAKSRAPQVARANSRRVAATATTSHQHSTDGELFNALIEAGRQLDLSATERESAGSFEDAIRLRKLAKKIRKLLPEIDAAIPLREANRRSD